MLQVFRLFLLMYTLLLVELHQAIAANDCQAVPCSEDRVKLTSNVDGRPFVCTGDQLEFTCEVLRAGSLQFAAEPEICRLNPLSYLSGSDVGDKKSSGMFEANLVSLDRNPPTSNFTVTLTGTPTVEMTLLVLCAERVASCTGVKERNITVIGPPDMPRNINSSLEDQICPDRSVNIIWEPPENADERSRYIVTVCEEDTKGNVCPLRKMEKDATNVTVTLKSSKGYLVTVVVENDCGSSSEATLFIPRQSPPDMPTNIDSSLEDQICPDRSVNIIWEPPENVDERSRYIVTVCEEDTKGDVCPLRKMEKDATNVTVTLKSSKGYLVTVAVENDCGSSSEATLFIPPQELDVCAVTSTTTLVNTTAVMTTDPAPEGENGSTAIIATLVSFAILVILIHVVLGIVVIVWWKKKHQNRTGTDSTEAEDNKSEAPIVLKDEPKTIVISECLQEEAAEEELPGNQRVQADTAGEKPKDKCLQEEAEEEELPGNQIHMKDGDKKERTIRIKCTTTDKGEHFECQLSCQFALNGGKLELTLNKTVTKIQGAVGAMPPPPSNYTGCNVTKIETTV